MDTYNYLSFHTRDKLTIIRVVRRTSKLLDTYNYLSNYIRVYLHLYV